jgi:hypothetical protein
MAAIRQSFCFFLVGLKNWEYCFDTQNNWRTHKKVVLPHIIKKVKAKLLKIKNNRIYVCL